MATHIVLPGDPLPSTDPTRGTYLHSNTLHASLAGPAPSKSPSPNNQSTIPSLPSVSDVILGRITRLTPRQATLDILALTSLPSVPMTPTPGSQQPLTSLAPTNRETLPFPYPHQALIRQQDIRATEIDKVTVSGSFGVGDIVRAVVISVGDERNYYCSTARDELGVVLGRSETGGVLVGVSWGEMVETGDGGRRERRKVAKVI
ncbi:hypothetical protein CAC42_7609 [Sphaceloma murrayae]|uniref:Exosome complex component CSL4 C-terminal domain-containing protein n=1 Tax=Sphaceloma murrayae TaxID=2082308 RepID=A0A2K1QTG7_9PEZI|nr:hypothetical protein CAC42_7609 [Sphaceloma murrayae]